MGASSRVNILTGIAERGVYSPRPSTFPAGSTTVTSSPATAPPSIRAIAWAKIHG